MLLALPFTMVKGQQAMAGRYRLVLDLHQVKGHPEMIYFWYDAFAGNERVTRVDSAVVKNNLVEFTGMIDEPQEAFLSTKRRLYRGRVNNGDRLSFYLTAGSIRIVPADSLNIYSQTGGSFSEDYRNFQEVKRFYDQQIIVAAIKVSQLDKHRDSLAYHHAAADFNKTEAFYANTICKNWVLEHPSSPVSLLPLRWYAGSVITNPGGVDSAYQSLSDTVKSLPSAMDLKRRVDNVMRSASGREAPLFSMPDTAGKLLYLSDYRGNYVLLDFWASWCAPCRRENPNVAANFRHYRSRNFVVVSVSLDNQSTKEAWLKAIQKDRLQEWPHVSDLKGFNSEAALLYGVQAVPQNFLIDPQGKIIGKNLFGTALSQKLEEVLGAGSGKGL